MISTVCAGSRSEADEIRAHSVVADQLLLKMGIECSTLDCSLLLRLSSLRIEVVPEWERKR